jgi:hypothetical protein
MTLSTYLITEDVDERETWPKKDERWPIGCRCSRSSHGFNSLAPTFKYAHVCHHSTFQAMRLKLRKDRAAFRVSYDWLCGRCGQSDMTGSKVLHFAGTNARHRKPHSILFALLSTSAFLYFRPKWWSFLPALTATHHVCYLHRIVQIARHRSTLQEWSTIHLIPALLKSLCYYTSLSRLWFIHMFGSTYLAKGATYGLSLG